MLQQSVLLESNYLLIVDIITWYLAATLPVNDCWHEIQTCSSISSLLGTKHCRWHHYTATGHKCFGQFLMYCFHFFPLENSVPVWISQSSTFVTFVNETKKKKSSAELSALREFDAVNFLQRKNMDSNIYALLQRKVSKIKTTKLLTICDFDCLTYL